MKIKIGNEIYDGNEVPIMVILTDSDKDNILHMPPNSKKYCQFPDDMSVEEAKEFMKTEDILTK